MRVHLRRAAAGVSYVLASWWAILALLSGAMQDYLGLLVFVLLTGMQYALGRAIEDDIKKEAE